MCGGQCVPADDGTPGKLEPGVPPHRRIPHCGKQIGGPHALRAADMSRLLSPGTTTNLSDYPGYAG